MAIALLAAGCQKKQLRKSELRSITRDLVAVAQKAAGRDTEIVIRPEVGARQGERGRLVADDIFINLPDAAKAPAVESALDRAAARYRLARVPRFSSADVIRFDYWLNGRRTHSIHIT
ncbi:MAG: hypothetical protein ACRD33_01720, partial [Candidatus Acidiferrales bacterium]